jgi:hypothetical protein
MTLEKETMGDMEEGAAEDYARSFEPAETPGTAPAYEPQQQPYGGEYDEYLEGEGEAMEPQPQQMVQQPLAFKDMAQMASAIADSLVTEEGSNYVGPAMYDAFSKYTAAQEMYAGPEKDAAVKSANREITKRLTEMGVLLFADLMPRTVPAMAVDAMEQSTESGSRLDSQYERAREKVALEYPELRSMRPEELEALSTAYENETGYDLAEVQFRNPRTGRPLGPAQNAEAQYRHGLAWARGRGYIRSGSWGGNARTDLDGEIEEMRNAYQNRRGLSLRQCLVALPADGCSVNRPRRQRTVSWPHRLFSLPLPTASRLPVAFWVVGWYVVGRAGSSYWQFRISYLHFGKRRITT